MEIRIWQCLKLFCNRKALHVCLSVYQIVPVPKLSRSLTGDTLRSPLNPTLTTHQAQAQPGHKSNLFFHISKAQQPTSNSSDETFGIAEVCNALAISRSQLHRKLKAITGKSTSVVLRAIRLEEARKRLPETDDNVTEIACQVGFGNPDYFSTDFSEACGLSPSKLRERKALQQ